MVISEDIFPVARHAMEDVSSSEVIRLSGRYASVDPPAPKRNELELAIDLGRD
jgi:hypothetical protein